MGGASGNGWYYQTSGTSPNRVLTVEWYHWGFWGNDAQDEMNIQIKLYETSNAVQFIYQPRTPEYDYDMQVGIMDVTTNDFNDRQGTGSWSNTTAGTDYCATVTYGASNYPADGLTFTFSPPAVGIKGNSNIAKGFKLFQNYPNPFNPKTNIKFDILKATDVKLTVFNVLGEEVATLINAHMVPGSYSVAWDAANYPSGVYFYRINAGTFSDIKKMVLMK
jgi:hypothetical protein